MSRGSSAGRRTSWAAPSRASSRSTARLRLQPVVERRDDERPAGLVFLERQGDGVVLAVGLERAGRGPSGVAGGCGEAADVDEPEVQGRLALRHPLGQHPARAAARGDAEGVEAGADEEVPHLRRLAEDEVAVGREGLRPVDHLLDAGVLQRRDAADGQRHDAARNGPSRRRGAGTRSPPDAPSAQGIGSGS